MKQSAVLKTLVIILLGMFALSAVPSVHAQQCSLTGVAGKYGFAVTGTLLLPTGPVLVGAVGGATLKADGTISGTEARNLGGGFANETFTGTFTVNPDCTGTSTLQFFESGALVRTSVISLVFDDNMKELRIVQQSLTLPDGTSVPVVLTAQARKMFPTEQQD